MPPKVIKDKVVTHWMRRRTWSCKSRVMKFLRQELGLTEAQALTNLSKMATVYAWRSDDLLYLWEDVTWSEYIPVADPSA